MSTHLQVYAPASNLRHRSNWHVRHASELTEKSGVEVWVVQQTGGLTVGIGALGLMIGGSAEEKKGCTYGNPLLSAGIMLE